MTSSSVSRMLGQIDALTQGQTDVFWNAIGHMTLPAVLTYTLLAEVFSDQLTARAGMEQPLYYWDPVIAPSGAVFYTGSAFPEWRGDLFVGSLRPGCLVRLRLDGDRVVLEERYLEMIQRRSHVVGQGDRRILHDGDVVAVLLEDFVDFFPTGAIHEAAAAHHVPAAGQG